jgi:hypothetical protein
MEIRDFIATPLVFILLLIAAWIIRPYLTDSTTRVYFMPALLVKFMGALALGFIYQFYYNGGDTYNFHTYGSRIIWEAFMDSPSTGLSMLFSGGKHSPEFFSYSSRIYFFTDPSSFFVIRVAAWIDLITFSSYSATALFFAFFSFVGSWLLFKTFYKKYPQLHVWLAIGALFIPSVFFWGSGILKDSLVMGCIGIIFWLLDSLFIERKFSVLKIVLLLLACWMMFSIKKFILQAYLPAALIWVYLSNVHLIQSAVLRIMVLPVAIVLAIIGAYYSAIKIGEDDPRYAIENLAYTSRITARDIRFQSGRAAGSGYELSEYFDGTLGNALRLAPQAINVTLFRPYLWEVKNPLMLMSALESLVLLLFTVLIIVRKGHGALLKILNPEVVLCFSFSIVYAFAVGVSTYNFGTLARYKIPILPFYFIGLVILYDLVREKKTDVLEETENLSTTV